MRSTPTSAVPGRRPNILVIMTDQERADIVRPDGFTLPARDRLAANGVRFGMHHTPTAPCSPARSAFFTGLHAPVSGVIDNVRGNELLGDVTARFAAPDLATTVPTLGAVLRDAGYRTAYIGKWHLSGAVGSDPAALAGYGFDESYDLLSGGGPDEGLREDPGVVRRAGDWLRQHGSDSDPWLCVVSMINPHDMMYCPRFYRLEDVPDYGAGVPANFESDLTTKPGVQTAWRALNQVVGGVMPNEVGSPEGQRQWRQWGNWYLELMRATDIHFGQVLDALDNSGGAGNTVVVQVADHGELGGAHGLRQKGAMIYRENLRVPLVIADPRTTASHGTGTDALTSHIDLIPTLAALAGATAPALPGRDLTPLLTEPTAAVRDAVLVTSDARTSGGMVPGINYCLRGTITPRHSFARYSTPEDIDGPRTDFEYELYDRLEDPLEMRNLAHDPGTAGLITELNDLVDSLIGSELQVGQS
ncbi:sulfatase-like hydrolase/transferase [Nocardia sp. NPDC019395]|uniref:sulfatase-like hydrolase/transferase n=1 Tax=Nocardia sp. NPDC019395 TaxID=3154686 RepID=UPI0033CC2FB1